MILIALLDDESAELDKTEKLLSDYEKKHSGLEFKIERFQNAENLLYVIKEENYMPDFIFMDIYMPDKRGNMDISDSAAVLDNSVLLGNSVPLGIEVAKELCDIEYKGKMVFLTMSREFALDAFRVNAVQYLLKPVSEADLFPVLDRFIEDMGRQKKYLLFKDSGIKRVDLHDIVYCEAQKKRQCLYLTDGTELLQSLTMTKIYEMLSVYPEFVKVGVSYIVNLEHIDNLNGQELQLDNGKKIYLPRGTYREIREQYFDYYCE